MDTNLFATAHWLRVENNQGYGNLPIPQPRDQEIGRLLKTWMALEETTRNAAARGILEDQRFTLLAYSERMASLAVRDRNPECITLGLLALGVDGWHGDWRDNATVVSLHYDASRRLGVDTGNLFEEVATLLPLNAANALRTFLLRSENDRTVEAMGYAIGTDADGFRYKRTW